VRLQRAIKLLLDVSSALLLLLLLSPLLAVVALLIRLKMGAPSLFRQQRPGLHERSFTLYKFRTMLDRSGPDGEPLPDAERLTPLGQTLRRFSMDELPQLWNVLCGDMSLVGPRPLLMEYLPYYSTEQQRRHIVRPGITGWAQINGRNAITWEERLALDVWYVEHWSLWLDLKILCLTFGKVLERKGISASQHATMPKFRGTTRGPQ